MPGEPERKIDRKLSSTGTSATYDKLLHLVGTGATHVTTVAEIARAMEVDSAHPLPRKLQDLANCGAHGSCDGNVERDFQRMVRGAYGFELQPYLVKLTLEDSWLIKTWFILKLLKHQCYISSS